ncbi:MAG: DUF72 domain-containing protein [Gemmatimonadota bacterium]|nr:DUF72 domain-containing protein [Gemmatimonadota bacterium]
MGTSRIGVSGWSYDAWHGDFYPDDLSRSRELEYASRRLSTVEINGSFYSLQAPDTYRSWREATPAGFRFAVKASRYITHSKRLKDARGAVANFLASGVLALGEKLGPVLWQLPERLEFEPERMREFLDTLPHDTESAARLAEDHDPDVIGTALTEVEENHRLRHAIETRHPSFFSEAFVRIARDTGTAIVFADSGDWPYAEEITAGFVYLRLHGSPETYVSEYDADALDWWANRIRTWADGAEPDDAERITDRDPPPRKERDVYVYFDNDAAGHAPWDALGLAARLGAGWDREDRGRP